MICVPAHLETFRPARIRFCPASSAATLVDNMDIDGASRVSHNEVTGGMPVLVGVTLYKMLCRGALSGVGLSQARVCRVLPSLCAEEGSSDIQHMLGCGSVTFAGMPARWLRTKARVRSSR